MKRVIVISILVFSVLEGFSQGVSSNNKNLVTTVGAFKSGSLVGLDVEYLLGDKLGIQAGVGTSGHSFGLNYHLSSSIRSSFISLNYWNYREIFSNDRMSAIGPSYTWRSKKWLTAQVGLGTTVGNSGYSTHNETYYPSKNGYVFTFSIGAYIPWFISLKK